MFEVTVREITKNGDKTSCEQIYQQKVIDLDLRGVIDAVNKQDHEVVCEDIEPITLTEDKNLATLDPLSEISYLKSWCEMKGFNVDDTFTCNKTLLKWQIIEITTLILMKSLFDGQYKAITNIELLNNYTKKG